MKRQLAVIAIAASATMLAGCVASHIPEVQEAKPIVVPESLKPTDVRGPMQDTDAACARSWAAYSVANSSYKATVGLIAGADKALAKNPDYTDPVVKNYFAQLGPAKVTFGESIKTIVSWVNQTQIEELLTTVGDGEIAYGQFATKMTDAGTTDSVRTAAANKYNESLNAMARYMKLCEGSIATSGGA